MSATDLAAVAPGDGRFGPGSSGGREQRNDHEALRCSRIESTEANRRAYRDTLLSTPGIEEYISGVILYDETIRQSSADGTPIPRCSRPRGSWRGIPLLLPLRWPLTNSWASSNGSKS